MFLIKGELTDLVFHTEEEFIFIASKDKTISLLNIKQEQLIHKFEDGHRGNFPKFFRSCYRYQILQLIRCDFKISFRWWW